MSVQNDICYSCNKEKMNDVLVKPCSNSTCVAKIHESCFKVKLDNDESKCGVCGSFIDGNKFRKFDTKKFVYDSYHFFLV
jgi:hypothetical protein